MDIENSASSGGATSTSSSSSSSSLDSSSVAATATTEAEEGEEVVRCRTVISRADAVPSWHTTRLSVRERDKQRAAREDIAFGADISETTAACEKLLRGLNMTNDKKYSWYFEEPIDLNSLPNYARVVARPLSRRQVLEGLAGGKYENMGELVEEMRLVYANALVFNGGGERDGTQPKINRDICDAARHMQGKLEEKLRAIVLEVAERLGKNRVFQALERKKIEEFRSQHHQKVQVIQNAVDDRLRQVRDAVSCI